MTETGPGTVRRLEIWQEGMSLVEAVYRLSATWPKEEIYGLTSQARRAAVSIPANIAEGVGRGTRPEAARFARIALASAYELHTLLELSARLNLTSAPALIEVLTPLDRLTRRLSRFIQYQEMTKA
ncbi:four helix bundle protein [Deinococcus aluminii]|uniref:Four helix bundle protein n=1 Tax=Deinococcus aluminii TaxID=1656885 RepID=A0ABP9X8G6_9DEIO